MNLFLDLAVLLSALSFTPNGGVAIAGRNNPFNNNNSSSSSPKKQPKGIPKRDVVLTLSTKKTSFAADEPVLIDVTLRNNEAKKPAKILDWVVPCDSVQSDDDLPTEMSFFDIQTKRTHHVAKYLGAVFKRLEPKDEDYKILQPGEEISCTIDLSEYYKFDAKANDNEYDIVYEVDSMQLSSPTGNGNAYGRQLETLQSSNTLSVQIDSRPDKEQLVAPNKRGLRARSNGTRGLQTTPTGDTTFDRCDSTEQSLLHTARSHAIDISTEVVNHLFNVGQGKTTNSCPRYEMWFGAYDASRHAELYSGYVNIRDDLDSANIVFDCGCNQSYYAYVYTNRPYEIFLCKAFWNAPMLGYNSKMGTVIHEISHFNIVAGTDDHAYGASACQDLADTNPNQAINNADNHEYMAENSSPNLTCDAAPPTISPGPTQSPTPCNGVDMTVEVMADDYPSEISYKVTNTCTGEELMTKSSFSSGMNADTYCVPDAALEFTIEDEYGDGLCCNYGAGNYKVMYKGVQVASGAEYGSFETTQFGSCDTGTNSPTSSPTQAPTKSPVPPTNEPTKAPSSSPTGAPTKSPVPPTSEPTSGPTTQCYGWKFDLTTIGQECPRSGVSEYCCNRNCNWRKDECK